MTTQEKLIRRKQSLLELAEYLQNISHACKINGVSRQHFYDIKKAYEEHGLEGLREKSRRKPCMNNRVAPEVEEAVAYPREIEFLDKMPGTKSGEILRGELQKQHIEKIRKEAE